MLRWLIWPPVITACLAAAVLLWGRGQDYSPDLSRFATDQAMTEKPEQLEQATLGGGCFWCVEAVYQRINGVWKVVSGYAGGHLDNPTYQAVTSGDSGHAEVVQISYDPNIISYAEILEIFWGAHDPTTLNRQGADVGTHYRSIILCHDDSQQRIASQSMEAAASHFKDPIVTEIVALEKFFPAEDYHQNYYNRNPNAGYCAFVIRPKLNKLRLK